MDMNRAVRRLTGELSRLRSGDSQVSLAEWHRGGAGLMNGALLQMPRRRDLQPDPACAQTAVLLRDKGEAEVTPLYSFPGITSGIEPRSQGCQRLGHLSGVMQFDAQSVKHQQRQRADAKESSALIVAENTLRAEDGHRLQFRFSIQRHHCLLGLEAGVKGQTLRETRLHASEAQQQKNGP